MKRASVLFAITCLLGGCDRPHAPSVDALATDPTRLHALLAQCRRGEHDGAFCAQVTQADLRRFLSGRTRITKLSPAGPDALLSRSLIGPPPRGRVIG